MFEPKGRQGVSVSIIGSDCMMSDQRNHHCHGAVVLPANQQLRILLHSSIGPHGQQTPTSSEKMLLRRESSSLQRPDISRLGGRT
jgi:hypothetical protein